MNAYADALLRYFDMFGRSSRSQYWWYQLSVVVVAFFAIIVDVAAGMHIAHYPKGILMVFVVVFHIVPQITISVRRLHDIGRSGFWYLLCFVPFGSLVLLYWSCLASDLGPNEYGDDPRDGPRPTRPRQVDTGFDRPKRSSDYASETLARMQSRQGSAKGQFTGL